MYFIGYDIGSSSVKATLLKGDTGKVVASAFYPKTEMKIIAHQNGWAEQEPEAWWENLKLATQDILAHSKVNPSDIKAIGISYQMHGLVVVGKDQKVLRPSIIWCDSRAVEIGNKAFEEIGKEICLSRSLNSPGNFTASKLKWVRENEKNVYDKIYKFMLPGDYIAMKMSGIINTTVTGLSEGILWDFRENTPASFLLNNMKIEPDKLADIVPVFSEQSTLSNTAAKELGLKEGTLISYRAGDQPNNAFSLNVNKNGEIAATAGTSGVVYAVSDAVNYDKQSRVNTFAHVNHSASNPSLGILMCINGTGILNSWLHKNMNNKGLNYPAMNDLAEKIAIGSEGLRILPFGNGAERILGNKEPGSAVYNLNFNIHTNAHFYRAGQEGIAFSFKYGIDIMNSLGVKPQVIRAGYANMFLSPVFRQTLANINNAVIELYETDGSVGAAKGAALGAGYYSSIDDAFKQFEKISITEPDSKMQPQALAAYQSWYEILKSVISL
ncbi:MAG: FGGY family carbohydrate kinase [Bacteroidales bacterium]